MATSDHTLDVRYHSKLEICALWGPILIRLVDGAPTEPADIDRVGVWLDELAERWPTIGMLTLAHHGTPLPSLATLRYSNQKLGALEDRMVIGIALLGLGYWAEAARAAVDSVSRIARRRTTYAFGSSVESVVERMALEFVGLDRARLCSVCAELERRYRSIDV